MNCTFPFLRMCQVYGYLGSGIVVFSASSFKVAVLIGTVNWTILAFQLWCKPSLDDNWICLYLETFSLTDFPIWCVPSTYDTWIFWLSLRFLDFVFVGAGLIDWLVSCRDSFFILSVSGYFYWLGFPLGIFACSRLISWFWCYLIGIMLLDFVDINK